MSDNLFKIFEANLQNGNIIEVDDPGTPNWFKAVVVDNDYSQWLGEDDGMLYGVEVEYLEGPHQGETDVKSDMWKDLIQISEKNALINLYQTLYKKAYDISAEDINHLQSKSISELQRSIAIMEENITDQENGTYIREP